MISGRRAIKTLLLSISFVGMMSCGLFVRDTFATNEEKTTITYPYYAFIEDPEHPWESVYDALDATDTIDYSDSFFDTPSPGDHPELRALSYALALAGYENQADGYPSSPASPNPKLYNLLDQMGFSDYQSWDIKSEPDGHSMGVTIGHKTLPSRQELVVVAPRNYNYMTEWLSNFDIGTTGDHAGFSESASYVKNDFDAYLSARDIVDYKLWVVGYSRGGAVIDLFAKSINENLTSYKLASDDIYAYTFGAPRASVTAPGFTNIHDVKDGNDLLLGNVFPELWGFHNIGTYEEIHPADLEISTSVINISDLVNPTTAANILSSNQGLTKTVGTMNGREFMDSWMRFVTDNGLTREYFDTEVKAPLSAIMKLYQMRTLDKQGEFTGFISDTSNGLAGMVAGNAFYDLMVNYGGDLANFPAYLDLVKVLKGTAEDTDVDELITILTDYMGEYDDYETKLHQVPPITESEFAGLKENLPKLVKALSPMLIADAAYTQSTFGEDYSLYYTYTLVSNAENLVIGHIPESIMPILKSLIPPDDPDDPGDDPEPAPSEEDLPAVPNTGQTTESEDQQTTILNYAPIVVAAVIALALIAYPCVKILKKLFR